MFKKLFVLLLITALFHSALSNVLKMRHKRMSEGIHESAKDECPAECAKIACGERKGCVFTFGKKSCSTVFCK
ncbi:hypothetical protein COOONC_27744 [Cooperia oncophora]